MQWIKFEVTTPDKPEVHRIAEILDIDPDAVVGKLLRLWIWADQQITDTNAPSVSKALADRYTFCPGFADAMIKVGWLQETEDGLIFTNFERHNGTTAKKRAQTARRVAEYAKKTNAKANGNTNAPSVSDALGTALPRERVRVKKKNTNVFSKKCADFFEEFWEKYERKGSKKKALEQWKKLSDDDQEDAVRAIKFYFLEQSEARYRKDAERYLRDRVFESVLERNENGELVVSDELEDWGKEHGIDIANIQFKPPAKDCVGYRGA